MFARFHKNKSAVAAITGFLVLVMWSFAYKQSCISLMVPVFIGIAICITTYKILEAKRLCIANCYFKKNTLYYKLLTKRLCIFINSLINGLILSIILVLSVIGFNAVDFVILFLDLLLILFLYKKWSESDTLNERVKEPVVKNVVSVVNSLFLLVVYFVVNLYQSPPDYIQNDLLQTVRAASGMVYSSCPFIDTISRVISEIGAVKWWLMLYMTVNIDNYHIIKIIIWTIFLLGGYLMIFAYTRYILQLVGLVSKK